MDTNLKALSAALIFILFATASYAVTQNNFMTFQNNTNVVITTFCAKQTQEPCTSSEACSITSYYPDLTLVANNKGMIFSVPGFFNHTLGVLNVTGDYPTFINCTDGTINKSVDATFRVVLTLNESNIYEKDTNVTLRGLCIRPDSSRCTSSEACALTTYNPDSTIRINKTSMIFEADGFFKYNLGVLSIIGDYFSFMNCTDGTFNRTMDASFKVILSTDQRFHIDINNTLGTINKTVIDANVTLATINKTVIDANNTLSTLNRSVLDINSSILTLNNTLLTSRNGSKKYSNSISYLLFLESRELCNKKILLLE